MRFRKSNKKAALTAAFLLHIAFLSIASSGYTALTLCKPDRLRTEPEPGLGFILILPY